MRVYTIILAVMTISLIIGCSDTPSEPVNRQPGPVNKPPVATITSPTDGESFVYGHQINFEGSGVDPEEDTLSDSSLVWTSDKDGEIGIGRSFSRDDLSVNLHKIILTISDSLGSIDTDTIVIQVAQNRPPVAMIARPTDGESFVYGHQINFEGSGVDPEEDTLSDSSLVWTSDKDGEIGIGRSFSRDDLSVNLHKIILTISDNLGSNDADTIDIEVTQADLDSLVQLTFGKSILYSDWSFGNVIFYISDGDIFRINSDGTNQLNFSDTPNRVESTVSSSPDGSRIAYLAKDSMSILPLLYTAYSDGNSEKQLSVSFPISHCWSPDGQAIAIFWHHSLMRNLFILNLTSGTEHSLIFDPGDTWISSMDWSQDKIIANLNGEASVIETVSGSYQKLGFAINNPDFSNDGSRFLYDFDGDIYLVNDDGTDKINLTNTANVIESHPNFSPEGEWITFIRDGAIFMAFLHKQS